MSTLTFQEMRKATVDRVAELYDPAAERFSLGDWGNAIAGETGELCNVLKKLRRFELGQGFMNAQVDDVEALKAQVGHELADIVLYADMIAERFGLSLGANVREKFNIKSDQWGAETKL